MTAAKARGITPLMRPIAVALTLIAGCGHSAESSKTTGNSATLPISSADAVGSNSASASASASAAPHTPTVAFRYAGGFEAKKRTVTLPSGVSEPVWGLDKGKASTGPGKIELSLWDDGRINGSLSGSLGDLTIEGYGTKEGGTQTLSGSISPGSGKGFRGTFSAKLEGNDVVGELHVASEDASIVREGTFTLHPVAP